MQYAHRLNNMAPFHVMRLLAEAKALEAAGHDIIHMEVGEPDFPTPEPIVAAGQAALTQGFTRYTPAMGLPRLREAISAYYQQRYQLEIPAARVMVTPGASGALQLLMALLVDPGSEVLMADPGYPCNRNFACLYGGIPVSIPVDAESGFQLTADLIRQYWKPGISRVVLLTTPANPTGAVISPAALAEIADAVRALGGFLVVDEIYQGLIYEVDDHTALALGEQVFVINSFSKYFGMTGWRVGWLVAPESALAALDMLAQNLFLATATLSQYAALVALSTQSRVVLEQRRQIFQQRRDFLLPELQRLGFRFPYVPQGAFYLYANCSDLTGDSQTLAKRLLLEAGVATTPGIDFSVAKPELFLRFAYTTRIERLQLAIERISSKI